MDNWYNTYEYYTFVAERLDVLGQTKYSREASEFALEVYECATQYYVNIPKPPPNIGLLYNLDAYNFAHCFLLHAKEVFENPGHTLSSWGLITSKDIGEVVYGLVSVGLLVQNRDDKKEQFEGLFLINNML
jgi:uncharacterized repeat protein (TIGR04138 family)